jgi:type 1 fimbria pilin
MQKIILTAVVGIALLGVLGLYSQKGIAAICTANKTSVTLDFGTITVQQSSSKVSAISSGITATGGYTKCPPGGIYGALGGIKANGADTGQKDGAAKLFTTNISGISVAVGATGNKWTNAWVGETKAGHYGANWILVSNNLLGGTILDMTAKIQLFSFGNLGSGKLSGKVAAFITREQRSGKWGTEIPIYITGTIKKLSCTLSDTIVSISLGNISVGKFTSVGTTEGDKSFDVGLTCDKNAKVNVSLSGTQNTDSKESSILALTSAGASGIATGVGVQLLYGDVPLKLNSNVRLKTSDGGKETLAFSARYYQTKKMVTAGKANATATLNITYQ